MQRTGYKDGLRPLKSNTGHWRAMGQCLQNSKGKLFSTLHFMFSQIISHEWVRRIKQFTSHTSWLGRLLRGFYPKMESVKSRHLTQKIHPGAAREARGAAEWLLQGAACRERNGGDVWGNRPSGQNKTSCDWWHFPISVMQISHYVDVELPTPELPSLRIPGR